MIDRARYLLSDIAFWVRSHPLRGALAIVAGLAVLAAAVVGIVALAEGGEERPLSPAPQVVVRAEEPPEDSAELGFPEFATANTTRVASTDPVATAAAVALATNPAAGPVDGPAAVTIVEAEDWAAGVAAASLTALPIGAPILLSDGDELPELTQSALVALDPQGSAATGNRQVFAVGGAPQPEGARTAALEGANAAELAAEIARLRERLTESEPAHIVIASSDEPAHAMPAAGWAARSGDPVLFAQRNSVPAATLELVEEWKRSPVYILGPESAISKDVQSQLRKASKAPVRRVAGEADPVESAVEFARFVDGTFGWNLNDPGHGFVIASAERPADAGAAAALSASGAWGPLLLTDRPDSPPPALKSYLLDLKPGFDEDPTRAVYNHIWIIGDETAVSVPFQVEVDEIAALAPVRSGTGESLLGPAPGTPEPESNKDKKTRQ